jgi:hypothetical protein
MASKPQRAEELPFGEEAAVPKPHVEPPASKISGSETAGKAVDAAEPSPSLLPTPRRSGRFAGLTYAELALGVLLLGAAIWGMWATSRIIALEDRRVVSVRLASIVNDFVSAEARSGTPPDQLEPRTRAFMSALDGVLKKRAASGQVVLVGEAVIASSVPDVTNEVVAELSKVAAMPVATAMPPAIPAAVLPTTPITGQLPPPAQSGPQPDLQSGAQNNAGGTSPFAGAPLPGADEGQQ